MTAAHCERLGFADSFLKAGSKLIKAHTLALLNITFCDTLDAGSFYAFKEIRKTGFRY